MPNFKRASLVALLAFAFSAVLRSEEVKPNFLFVLADDMAYDTIHEWGNGEIETPNLDVEKIYPDLL